MLKPDRFVSEKKKKVTENPIFKQLVNFEQEEEAAKARQRNKKKPYAQISDSKAKNMYGKDLVRKLE